MTTTAAATAAGGARATRNAERAIGLWLCAGVALAWVLVQLVPNPNPGQATAPGWLPVAAAAVAAAGLASGHPRSRRQALGRAIAWAGLPLMVWAANGLPFDVLTAAGLIGTRTPEGSIIIATVYVPGLLARALALGVAIVLARILLARRPEDAFARPRTWYGYVAFLLALPYPLMRIHWALGGTVGLDRPAAAGEGWEPLIVALPWVAAAVLSLLLVSPSPSVPRRPLVAAGWLATTVVAMIGPSAGWALLSDLATGTEPELGGIQPWIFVLFYGSWFLWALAGAAATRSYDLRSRR